MTRGNCRTRRRGFVGYALARWNYQRHQMNKCCVTYLLNYQKLHGTVLSVVGPELDIHIHLLTRLHVLRLLYNMTTPLSQKGVHRIWTVSRPVRDYSLINYLNIVHPDLPWN